MYNSNEYSRGATDDKRLRLKLNKKKYAMMSVLPRDDDTQRALLMFVNYNYPLATYY